jgi:hypothetical protein
MHLYDDGLVIGQFGIVAAYVGQWLPEAAAQMAGNASSNAVVVADDGSRYIYQNDESWHGGVHRWHVTGLDSIHEELIPVTFAGPYVPPEFPGLNLHEGLGYMAGVSDGLYGWHRTPEQDVTNDQRTDWWVVDTGRYAYRRDRPADIRANFSRPGTASVTRDLRPVGAGAVSAWTLSGQLTFGANYNRNEYGDNTSDCSGQYLEILDDTGKVIARLYPRGLAQNVAIHANTAASNVKVVSADEWNRTIWQTPTPFTVSASDGKLSFTFGDGSIANVQPFDSTANWQKPATMRMFFYHFHPNWSWPLEIGLAETTFSTTPWLVGRR